MGRLKLTVQPVPPGSAYASLANLLPRKAWDRVRREAYRKAGYRCQACGKRARLHCHEVWHFQERTGCQVLTGVQALCPECHQAKHLFPIRQQSQYRRSARHLMAVNGLSKRETVAYLRSAYREYLARTKRDWKVSFGQYTFLVPSLRDKAQRRRFAGKRHAHYAPTNG